jgi:sulfite reductase alpha subunit-like flavoprotein
MSENYSRDLLILYGSQTGTAQEVSENIWRESKRYHFRGSVKAMDDYDVRNLIDEKFVLFVCATTGQGGDTTLFIT